MKNSIRRTRGTDAKGTLQKSSQSDVLYCLQRGLLLSKDSYFQLRCRLSTSLAVGFLRLVRLVPKMAKVGVSFGESYLCLTWTFSDGQRSGHFLSGRLKCFDVMLCAWETWLAASSVLTDDAIEPVDTARFDCKEPLLLYSSGGYEIQCQTYVSVACHSCNMWTWTVFLGS